MSIHFLPSIKTSTSVESVKSLSSMIANLVSSSSPSKCEVELKPTDPTDFIRVIIT